MIDLQNPIYTDENAAREHLESLQWPDGPVCPRCGVMGDRITKLAGKSTRPGVYKCKDCRKPFSVTVGTLFERSHIPLTKWLLATDLLCASKKGMSAHQLHRMLGVTYKTAWFMAHRIREAMNDIAPEPMGGEGKTIEADETYLGGTKRGRNSKGRRYGQADKMKVFALVERGGKARSIKVERVTSKSIRTLLVQNADRASHLRTDEAMHFRRVGKEFASHERVHHALEEYVRGDAHTNTIEGYFSIFKRGMKGVYQHCGEQHLQRYLVEFDFRYNHRAALGVSDSERTVKALQGIQGKRLTYRQPSASQA